MITSHVKNHFEKRCFTAADFARWCARREIDLSYYTARRVVAGETDITLSTAGTVAEFLDVPLNELFTVASTTPAPSA